AQSRQAKDVGILFDSVALGSQDQHTVAASAELGDERLDAAHHAVDRWAICVRDHHDLHGVSPLCDRARTWYSANGEFNAGEGGGLLVSSRSTYSRIESRSITDQT